MELCTLDGIIEPCSPSACTSLRVTPLVYLGPRQTTSPGGCCRVHSGTSRTTSDCALVGIRDAGTGVGPDYAFNSSFVASLCQNLLL